MLQQPELGRKIAEYRNAKGRWRAVLNSGGEIGGEYISEWKLTHNEWLIVSESSGLSHYK